MSDAPSILDLVSQLSAAMVRFDELAFDEVQTHEKGPPATREELDMLEKRLGQPLPASYRDFLGHHNGWSQFVPGGALLSTSDQQAGWIADEIASWTKLWNSPDPNPFARGAIPVMFGQSLTYFLVLDPTRRSVTGSMEFIEFDNMAELSSYGDFGEYLASELRARRLAIEQMTNGTRQSDPGSSVL